MIGGGYTWAQIKNYLFTLATHIPSGETLELGVFGGCTVLHWGMEDRLSRDLDVLHSDCSPNLVEVAQVLSGAIRFTEEGESEGPYVEVAPVEANAYLPRFTVYERIEIAPNLILKIPFPDEIAASKMAFADRLIRLKDLQDIAFLQDRFGITQEQILRKIFTIEKEGHRRSATMNLNQLSYLVSQIPVRQAQLGEESLQNVVQQMEQRLHENPAGEEESESGQRI
jgi:hypothetical protein